MLFATAIAFFIFSGVFYSHGAFNISPTTFILMGVSPHVWGEVLPWLNIFATLAIYILVWTTYKFFKNVFAKDIQDEVSLVRLFEFTLFFKIVLGKTSRRQGKTQEEPVGAGRDSIHATGLNTKQDKGKVKFRLLSCGWPKTGRVDPSRQMGSKSVYFFLCCQVIAQTFIILISS